MTNNEFIRNWFQEVWNNKNENAIDELMHPEVIAHGLFDENGNELCGPESFKSFFRNFIASFPTMYVEVINTVSEGDNVVALCHVTMNHSGADFKLSDGNYVKANGQQISFTGTSWSKIVDGKLIEGWNNFDFLTMYLQLNAIKFIEHGKSSAA